jgi:stage III sporulation protein AC
MQIDLIFRIAVVGILVAVLNTLLIRSGRDEQATMVVLTGFIVVLMIVLREVSDLFEMIKDLFGFY